MGKHENPRQPIVHLRVELANTGVLYFRGTCTTHAGVLSGLAYNEDTQEYKMTEVKLDDIDNMQTQNCALPKPFYDKHHSKKKK